SNLLISSVLKFTHYSRVEMTDAITHETASTATTTTTFSPSHSCSIKSNNKMNAYANKAAGKGYENENFYENIKFNFFGIENIHVMRGSLAKLIEGKN